MLYGPTVAPDGSGGAIITWKDQRNGYEDDVYAQRVDHAGVIVKVYGTIGVNDNAPGDLNAPYDAKVIGDYTGLTNPVDSLD